MQPRQLLGADDFVCCELSPSPLISKSRHVCPLNHGQYISSSCTIPSHPIPSHPFRFFLSLPPALLRYPLFPTVDTRGSCPAAHVACDIVIVYMMPSLFLWHFAVLDDPQEEPVSASKQNKKKKQKIKAAASSELQAEPQTSTSGLKKAIKKASAPLQNVHDVTETPPAGKKAGKKKAAGSKLFEEGTTMKAVSDGETSKGKQAAGIATPATASTPASEGVTLRPRPTEQPTTGKKSVRFAMKNNLYFQFGGPLPDPEVRTPPRAQPKGPALKRVSSLGPSKTPNMFGKRRAAPRTPRSAPRPSALDFF